MMTSNIVTSKDKILFFILAAIWQYRTLLHNMFSLKQSFSERKLLGSPAFKMKHRELVALSIQKIFSILSKSLNILRALIWKSVPGILDKRYKPRFCSS